MRPGWVTGAGLRPTAKAVEPPPDLAARLLQYALRKRRCDRAEVHRGYGGRKSGIALMGPEVIRTWLY